MNSRQFVFAAFAAAMAAAPGVALADHTETSTRVQVGNEGAVPPVSTTTRQRGDRVAETQQEQPGILRETARIDESFDRPLESGCTYHATVRGTVRPVPVTRGESVDLQRLRPDLRVGSTVRCPNSTEAHIQERAVRSTGVTREEFEHLLALNASVQRMQNSGRCMYLPEFTFNNAALELRDVRYLCPAQGGGSRGGGPRSQDDRDLQNR